MPATRDFLLEIGVEEMPATHLQPACDHILESFKNLMKEARLACGAVRASSTPRRFFLLARGVQEMQDDIRIIRTGPARKIAYDAEGKLTPAALGFLKKNSANADDIYIDSNEKGDFIAVSYLQPGKPARDLLRAWINELLHQIPFPKTMVWNSTKMAFSRPVRWLCVLWGTEVIKLDAAGISSGNYTFGNRYLGLGTELAVASPDAYLGLLRENAVLADRSERRDCLTAMLDQILANTDLNVIPDERLADTVTDLVEYPTAVVAEFDPGYLNLPHKIITSTISQNQKYFAVSNPEGELSNKFVFISNGDPNCADLIRKGNEKVVAARLADALWYFQEDTKRPLHSYLPLLDEVVFQSKLGSMGDKSRRIKDISEFICQELGLGKADTEQILRTAELCKADLVTNMLGEKEFTKLQGYIGKQYALASGESSLVAEGIYEHYMPRGSNDGLPETLTGAVVAVADKLDSVCGIIGIGLVPTGSADPFALRRAANGVVQIICERGWPLDLSSLIKHTMELESRQAALDPGADRDVLEFIVQRVEWLFKQNGLEYDVIDSVMHLGLADLSKLKQRAEALQSFKPHEDFLRLVIGFKRVANILEDETEFAQLRQELFSEPVETELYDNLQALKQALSRSLEEPDYAQASSLLVGFGVHIDNFFDAVLVNCEDAMVRNNRHALLYEVKKEFLRVADISRIVLENEIKGA